jgi:O-antigen ligase
MTGVFAALIELFRAGRTRDQVAMGLNFLILLAAGGRGALFGAVMVSAVAFICLPSVAFPRRRRLPALLLGGILIAVGVAIASGGTEVRILNVLSTKAESLSGRDLIWPLFEQAWDASPWFGWGVGAGKVVVDPDSLLAHLLGTTAAHNEYLRMGVEGGYVGLGLLILTLSAWVFWGSRPMRTSERIILRLILLSFGVHAMTDNLLIAAPASVYFAWMSAVFQRARQDTESKQALLF